MARRTIIIAPDPRLKSRRSRSPRWTTTCAASWTTCSRPCTRRPVSASPRPRWARRVRVLVLDVAGQDEAPRPMTFANPEIVWASDD